MKVDELSGEVEILSEQLNTATQAKHKLMQKVSDLEEELKKTKDLVKQQSKSTINRIYHQSFVFNFVLLIKQTAQIMRMKEMYQWLKGKNSLVLKWLVFLWKEIK